MGRVSDLLDKACAATGLDNFGDPGFREGLERLVDSADREARLNDAGKAMFDGQSVMLLTKRLEIEDWYTRHPEIDEQEIVAPLMVLGLPRTGSTALHCLLGEDPHVRVIRNWEGLNPCPPPEAATQFTDPRIAEMQRRMELRDIEPHPLSGTMYEGIGDGKVKVQKEGSNAYGIFTWKGEWLEGEVTQADPQMLLYIAGPDLPRDHEVIWMSSPSKSFDGTIPMEAFPGTHMDEMPRIVARYQADTGLETKEGWRSNGNADPEFFLDNDRVPERVPEAYRLRGFLPGGPKRISTDRYWKQEFHDLEVEHIWKKTWQMACREDEIPNVGDYYVYDIAHLSYLVVRTEDGIRAHQNVCLHRGRLLKDCSGRGEKEFRCPFHGWAWKLDGSLKEITAEWDFPGVREEAKQLPAVSLQTWEGFIFINPDPDAEPLAEFLGPVMMEHYTRYGFKHRYIQANVSKLIRANWKVVMEAFMEAYHVIATHPHQMLTSGDLSNTHYDVFGNWGRSAQYPSPGSPQRGIFISREEALTQYRTAADGTRGLIGTLTGDDLSGWSDAELNGNAFNDLFPNLHPWGGWMRICFRFRPNGSNPEESIMDILLLAPWPKDKPRPAPAKPRKLSFDDAWTAAPELLSLSKITDQDVLNLPSVQRGLKAKNPPHVWYSNYQEMKIRNFHINYENALGLTNETPES